MFIAPNVCRARSARSWGRGLLVLAGLLLAQSAQAKPGMSFDQRVACQAKLEDIRWSETIWPEQNPEPKPDRQSVLSDAQLRDKVDDQLRQEAVLAADYGQRMDAASLQRELNRMATFTRAPDRLAKRFNALGNDAERIAECLARPQLVQQRLRAAYASDPRQHGALRRKAEAALAGGAGIAAIETSGGSEQVRVLVRRDDDLESSKTAASAVDFDSHELPLDADDFDAERARLTHNGEIPALPGLPPHPNPLLRESDHTFVQETLLSESADRLEVWVRHWPKRSFDGWWAERRQQAPRFSAAAIDGLTLPTIRGRAVDFGKAAANTWELRAQVVPSPRYGHSAVWTGSEMIIWGGRDMFTGDFANTGGRYSPATDSWGNPTATTDAPGKRAYHSAVWTGSEMIIWGGSYSNFGDHYNTGGRYNPETDSWGDPISTTDAPSARGSHAAVWTGSEMIVWGGQGGGANLLDTGGRYNPDTDSWGDPTSTIGAPSARSAHTAVWTGSEMIIWGGNDGSNWLGTGGRYNPDTDSWGAATETNGAPDARGDHSAVWIGSEMIIWGGRVTGVLGSVVNGGRRYNPDTDSWGAATETNGAPSARAHHSAAWTGSEMIIWGGSEFDGASFVNTGGRYDPSTDTWGTPTDTYGSPVPRMFHGAVWTGSEMIVWGGFGGCADPGICPALGLRRSGGRYDVATNRWSEITITDAPSRRADHSVVWTGSEMVVWGGQDHSGRLDDGGRYNPTSDTWSVTLTTTGAPSPRRGHRAVWTGSQMIVWGGEDDGSNLLDTGGRYNPANDTWSVTPTSTTGAPSGRYDHSAVWTGSEMIVWGGYDSINVTNTGAVYDPDSDTWGDVTETSGAPTPRYGHSVVWTGSEMIVWGGHDGNDVTNTGGRYRPDSNTWGDATETIGAPTPRQLSSAVWTGREMIIWAGINGSSLVLADMGLYTPWDTASLTTLTSLAPSPSPVNQVVAATVQVAGTDRAPVDGTVTVTATTGESCSDSTPASVDTLTVEYACDLTFTSAGTRDVSAAFSDSSSHDNSSSIATSHLVIGLTIFSDGFE